MVITGSFVFFFLVLLFLNPVLTLEIIHKTKTTKVCMWLSNLFWEHKIKTIKQILYPGLFVNELKKTIKLLTFDVERMVNESNYFDLILGGQKPYLDKADLGYIEKHDNYLFKFPFKLFEPCQLS